MTHFSAPRETACDARLGFGAISLLTALVFGAGVLGLVGSAAPRDGSTVTGRVLTQDHGCKRHQSSSDQDVCTHKRAARSHATGGESVVASTR